MARIIAGRSVALAEIDDTQKATSFSWPHGGQRQEWEASCCRSGILRPLLCRERDGALTLLAGHRRLKWLRENAREQAPVAILAADGEVDLWDHLLADSLDHRPLNPVEKGLYLQGRRTATGEDGAALSQGVFPQLGLGARADAADDLFWLVGQPRMHWEGFADGSRPLHALRSLRSAAGEDALAILELTAGARGGVNKFTEVVHALLECAWRDGITVSQWLQREQLCGPWQSLDDLRRAVRLRRFPELSAWEERFPRVVTAAGLARGVQLQAPRGFEGSQYECRLRFSRVEQLEAQLEATLRSLREGRLQDLREFLE